MPNGESDANRAAFDDQGVVGDYATAAGQGLMADEALLYEWYVPRGAAVLDLGIGTGRTTGYLQDRAGRYVGIDYAPRMVEAAQLRHPDADMRVADATDLSDFADESFDSVVFSYNGLDYLHPDAARIRCLSEIRRLLRPGGSFLFTRHNPRGVIDPGSFRGTLPKAALVGALITARRARRMMWRSAFFSGEGYVVEPIRGGLITHMASRRACVAELARYDLDVVETLSGRSSRLRPTLVTPWLSYAAVAR